MVNCILVKNIFTQTQLKVDYKVADIQAFLNDIVNSQQENVAYLYKFTTDNYLAIKSSTGNVIDKLSDIETVILENIFNKDKYFVESIIQNVKVLMKQQNINEEFDENKARDLLKKLDKHPETIKFKTSQNGGVFIWMAEQYIIPKMPRPIQTIFTSIIEFIDIILIVGIAIPGLQLVGVGVIIDIVSLIYCFLRFDIIGMIASCIALIPVLGNILGGTMRVLSKVFRFYSKYRKSKKIRRLRQLESFTNDQDDE